MDVIFDIDGTLADATHRLHWIKDTAYFVTRRVKVRDPDEQAQHGLWRDQVVPNWEMFLDEDLVFQDSPIPESWAIMWGLLKSAHRVIFITGRNEETRISTEAWLADDRCPIRKQSASYLRVQAMPKRELPIYMRSKNDRRPSHEVKRDLLKQARADGYDPKMVFEDRIDDTRMWREEGLRCFQVAEGNY